ncbi:MAG: protein translocase subunit SecD [Verrucomicrobia bacterium]|nr:protein translocase subunit SecD [Verrucomicrobiota bacterium]
MNRLQKEASGKIKLGLDLIGGSSFLVEMQTNKLTETTAEVALDNAVEVLRKRVDRYGVAEPLIQKVPGQNRIMIQMPGLSQDVMEDVRVAIQKAAFLEFRMVHADNDELLKGGIVPPGYEIKKEARVMPNGEKVLTPYIVDKKRVAGLSGKDVQSTGVIRNNMNQPEIAFTLKKDGAAAFADITTKNVGRLLAILLDGELYSAPRINTPITEGNGVIQGSFGEKEAFELANVLQNPLEAPVQIVNENTVDPSLGRDAIRSGVTASIVGTLAVSAFMALYYLLCGMVANIALIMNIILLIGVMCSIGTTFTLPGIAGVVLTVGMAVDANVLIFERIREELGKGKSLKGALPAGYARAFGTILDSHVTTLISSVILWRMGVGTIKGFGVALTIGVAASLFTSLVVTRLIFDFLLAKKMISSFRMFHLIRNTKVNFMGVAKMAFIGTWLFIVLSCGYGLIFRGDKAMGIDFKGGDNLTLRFAQKDKIDVEKIRSALKQGGMTDPQIQYQKEMTASVETLRITVEPGAGSKAETALKKAFPQAEFSLASLDKVGPTIGREIQKTAVIASLLSLFGILIYVAFRYEFSFAVGAVLAIFHDVLLTIGAYYLSGREFNTTTVAAILTIIGFSTNDTIVIFDRIREDLRLGVRGTFWDLINQAINQTLSRTLITSGTVFLSTLALFIFGGGAINDFAFTFLVGIITGTYSSIYIASALVLWWHKGERPALGAGVAVESGSGPAPAKA